MCGIAGSIGALERSSLQAMLSCMAHRGPDQQGMLCEEGVSLGSCRLSINGIASGRQPIFSEDGSVAVVLNGEIYNYPALKKRLELAGHVFSTDADTEAIVHAYEQFGDKFLPFLSGEFAFALYDSNKRRVLLCRDRLGVKPLFYCFDAERNSLVFASEIKALLACGAALRERGSEPLESYFRPYGNYTPFKGVFQVMPGSMLKFQAGDAAALCEEKYYRFSPSAPVSQEETFSLLREKLQSVVSQMSLSEAPLGALLSGGLDSSILCSLLKNKLGKSFDTFCVGSVGANEFSEARQVAEFIGSRHHEVPLEEEEICKLVPSVVYALESFDAGLLRTSIPMFKVFSQVRTRVKTVLSGEGADELFAGYPDLFMPVYAQRGKFGLQMELEHAVQSLFLRHLARLDRISMANSVEGRVPFMDYRFVEFALGIDPSLKVKNGVEKFVLRKAFEGAVPAEISARPKCRFGIGAGVEQVLAREFGQNMQSVVERVFDELFIEGKLPFQVKI